MVPPRFVSFALRKRFGFLLTILCFILQCSLSVARSSLCITSANCSPQLNNPLLSYSRAIRRRKNGHALQASLQQRPQQQQQRNHHNRHHRPFSYYSSKIRNESSKTAAVSAGMLSTTLMASTAKTALPLVRPDVTYDDLSVVGKIVAGTVEVGFTILFEYAMGFFGGYILGAVTDVPRILFTPMTQQPSANPFVREAMQRIGRMNVKSVRWGKSWASISAAFSGFKVATKVYLRNGKDDEWTTLLSSMAAGAYFARADGPQAMLRGALFYGGLVYILNGNLMQRKKPFQYEDQDVEF